MPLEVFPFVNHTPRHVYPKGDAFQFGGGYVFAAKPQQVQRRIILSFQALIWYKNVAGTAFDSTIDPENNALNFDEFYRRHLTYKSFTYNHDVYGAMEVKFAADVPFEMPKTREGGVGVTESFEVTLVEQP
ncbi:hypothetical protein CPT_Seuss23 [Caulobacter phage Seuss]|uniref:Uncharacterized protein n=1 Tax=Caulobacter phage Seuss TaxID=1675601 RepID=A0A0K1LM63_9CAUD|nr:hypothetical protein HOR08_gp023 [Caulobacter phage Seuss]AKU43549.1 hypothetical protein CPT_Seuss23 [Caulobacter phage Seuss]